jgi:hypothetical protein
MKKCNYIFSDGDSCQNMMPHEHPDDNMQGLIPLFDAFVGHIDKINYSKEENGRQFEDDIEPTFANFIKWYRWNSPPEKNKKESILTQNN